MTNYFDVNGAQNISEYFIQGSATIHYYFGVTAEKATLVFPSELPN